MAVDFVNNTNKNSGMYALGAGAVSGIGAGAYGYYSKSYLKDGEFKDSFIKTVGNKIFDSEPGVKKFINGFKKIAKEIENIEDAESLKKLFGKFVEDVKKTLVSGELPNKNIRFDLNINALDIKVIDEFGVEEFKKGIKKGSDNIDEIPELIVKACFDGDKKLKLDKEKISKELFYVVKKAVKEVNLKSAGLWGGITAGVVGLGTYLFTKNNKNA